MATNDPKKLMDLQLEYLLKTMKPGGGEWLNSEDFVADHYNAFPLDPNTPRNMSYNDYITSNIDAGQLALVFQATYERSGDHLVESSEGRLKERHGYAINWYNFLKSK